MKAGKIMENKTKEEYKKRIMLDFTILFVILIVISIILMVLNLISGYKEFLISENIRFMLYGFAIFFIIFILVDVFTEALNMRKAISEKNKIKKKAKKLEHITPGLVELLVDYEADETDKEIAVIAGLISKDFIEVNSEGKVIQKSLDRKKWLKHEKLVFDKYKNHSYVDIPDYLQILINDSNKLLLLKKTLSDKEYKFVKRSFMVSFIITVLAILKVSKAATMVYVSHSIIIPFAISLAFGIATMYFLRMIFDYNYPVENPTLLDYYLLTTHGENVKKEIEEFRKELYEYSIYNNEKIKDEDKYVDIIPFAFAIGEYKILEKRIVSSEKYKNLFILMKNRALNR